MPVDHAIPPKEEVLPMNDSSTKHSAAVPLLKAF